MSQPTTPAGKLLLRNFDVHVKGIADDMTDDQLVAAVVAIESDARDEILAALRSRVEALVEEAGGRCVKPADYDDEDGIAVCETHSELMYGDREYCEDQPLQLLRVLALLAE